MEQYINSNIKICYTIKEACEATGIGRTSIYELISNGSLKSFKAAGRRLIRKSDLEAYLDTCFQKANPHEFQQILGGA